MIWFRNYSLEELAAVCDERGLMRGLNITLTEVGDDYLCVKMPVTPDLYQISGILHGGATCVLVETAGSICSRMVVDPEVKTAVGSVIIVNHLRPTTSGALVARAKAVHLGKQKHVWDIPVYMEGSDKLVAKGELTCAIIDLPSARK